jgi:hypothetical protein
MSRLGKMYGGVFALVALVAGVWVARAAHDNKAGSPAATAADSHIAATAGVAAGAPAPVVRRPGSPARASGASSPAPPAAAVGSSRPRTLPGIPHNLDEVPRSAGLEAALKSVTVAWEGSQQGVANLNYRLERLSDIADCTAGKIQQRGFVDVMVHFAGASKGAEAVTDKIEFKQVRLPEADRAAALRCIQQSLMGSRSVVADDQFADQPRSAPMRIRLPVEDSAIYSFLETGDMKYYGNDYDGRP